MSPRNEFENYDGYMAPTEAEDLVLDVVVTSTEDERLLGSLLLAQDENWSATRDHQIKNLRSKIARDANREGEPEEG